MNISTTKEIVAQIEDHARSLGMTPIQLCQRAGIAESTFRRWREGRHHPNFRTIRKLLATLKSA